MSTRVLLWSPLGAGEHYHGPGAFMYRLYRSAPSGAVQLELAHAYAEQPDLPLFAAQHRMRPAPNGAMGLAGYLLRSRQWLHSNAHRFEVMHAIAGFHASVSPAFYAQQLGLPAVLFVAAHNIEFTDKGGLRGLLNLAGKRRQMVKQLSAIVAMSRAIQDELLAFGVSERRIARIPMGIDVSRFRPARDEAERAALRAELGLLDLPTLLFVGGVTPRKRPHLLVEALGQLKRAGSDCQLLVAGPEHDKPYSESIRQRATELGVANRIRWLGHVTAVEKTYRASDFYALPSSNEGMPAALVEAMASSLPAIVTRISGCEDLVEHGASGFFVEPEVDPIVEALSFYLRDPAQRAAHGERGRARVVKTCSNETVLQAHLSLFAAVQDGIDPAMTSTLGPAMTPAG